MLTRNDKQTNRNVTANRAPFWFKQSVAVVLVMSDDEFDGAEAHDISGDDEFNGAAQSECEIDVSGPALKRPRGPHKPKVLAQASTALFCAILAVTGARVECWAVDEAFAKQKDRLPHYEHPPLPRTPCINPARLYFEANFHSNGIEYIRQCI